MNIEEMLREDAQREDDVAAHTGAALTLLRPHIARASLELERKKKTRKGALLLALIMVPALLFVGMAARAYMVGNRELACAIVAPVGLFSLFALLLTPFLENIFAKKENRGASI